MQLTDALLDLCKFTTQPIISIDGRAGAGKTTLADLLKRSLSGRFSVEIIHLDNLYNGWSSPFDHHLTNALMSACQSHRAGKSIEVKHFNWEENSFGSEVTYPQSDLLILEGVGATQQAVRPHLTTSIWIDIDIESGMNRVIDRDGEISAPYIEKWIVAQEKHFETDGSREAADFILALEI